MHGFIFKVPDMIVQKFPEAFQDVDNPAVPIRGCCIRHAVYQFHSALDQLIRAHDWQKQFDQIELANEFVEVVHFAMTTRITLTPAPLDDLQMMLVALSFEKEFGDQPIPNTVGQLVKQAFSLDVDESLLTPEVNEELISAPFGTNEQDISAPAPAQRDQLNEIMNMIFGNTNPDTNNLRS